MSKNRMLNLKKGEISKKNKNNTTGGIKYDGFDDNECY